MVLGLGSNLGDRLSFIEQGHAALETAFGKLVAASRILETEPWGVENHPSYLNQVLIFSTQKPVREVLEITQRLEKTLGRSGKGSLQARTLDIDHPISGTRMHFESPLPADMQAVLERWRTYIAAKPFGDDDEEPLDKEAVNNMR